MAWPCAERPRGCGVEAVTFREEEAVILSLEDFVSAILAVHDKLSAASLRSVDLATVTGTMLDVGAGRTLLSELGLKGSYYTKMVNGKTYVVLRGYAQLRNILNGTRYLARNPQMLTFGLGPEAIKAAAKTNGLIMIVCYVALDIAQFILSDEMLYRELFANLIVDVAIGAAAIAAGALAAIAFAGVSTIAIPVAAVVGGAIAVGLIVSSGLAQVAGALQLKERLASALGWTYEAIRKGIKRTGEVIHNAHQTVRQKIEQMDRGLGRFHYDLEREIIHRFYPNLAPYFRR